MHSTISRLTLATVLLWGAACGGESATPPIVTPPAIAATATPAAVSVAQGETGTTAIAVARTNFGSDVVLTAEGLPTGVTATFTPSTLIGGATSSSLSLAVSGSTAVGTTAVTVRARGSGVTDATAPVSLTVAAGAVNPTVTLDVAPATASIVAGLGATAAVGITRSTGFTGGVNMTVTGAPTGMTTAFSPANPITAGTVSLSVTTLPSVVPGPYTLTVRANATGIPEATATYVVTVAPPPTNRISWRFCKPDIAPLWFAVQDGLAGTWQPVTAVASVYEVAVGQPQVGIAMVRPQGGRTVTEIRYYAQTELAAAAAAECVTNPAVGTKTLTGFISGFASADETATATMGAVSANVTSLATPAFTITNVVDGPVDFIAVRTDVPTSTPVRVRFVRGVNAPSGTALGTADVGGGTSFAPGAGTLTVSAPNDGPLTARNIFTTAPTTGTGTSVIFAIPGVTSGQATPYLGIPVAQLLTAELQQVQATQEVGTTITRFISRYTRGPGAVNVTMPADPSAPTIANVAIVPYPRASMNVVIPQPVFSDRIEIAFDQQARSRRWVISATAAGRENAGSFVFTMPDFSGVAGWQNTWAMGSGSAATTSSFSGRTAAGPDGAPIAGTTIYTISRIGTHNFL